MKDALRLLLAFALPPAAMMAYDWAAVHFGLERSLMGEELVEVVPILAGVVLISTLSFATAAKLTVAVLYVLMMLIVAVCFALSISCYYGGCF